MALGAGFSAYRSKLAEPLSKAGFDWATIIKFIQDLIAGCGKPSVLRVRIMSARKGKVAAAMYQMDPELSDAEAFKIADIHHDAVKASSNEELQAFIDDCCS